VFVTRNRDFRKGKLGAERRLLLGNGLATSDGDYWRRQRRLAQPAFHRERIAAYGESMVAFTEEMTAAWRDGEVRDLHADMMRVTLGRRVVPRPSLSLRPRGGVWGTVARRDMRRHP